MIENLRNGYWVGPVPIGYTNLKRKEKANIPEIANNHEGISRKGKFLELALKRFV